MKTYLSTALAISALSIFAATSNAAELVSVDTAKSLNENAVSLNTLELNSTAARSSNFNNEPKNYALELSPKNNSFSLSVDNKPESNLIIKNTNFGQPSYSVSTTLFKF